MSPKLQEKLLEAYPLLFRKRHRGLRATPVRWGFEVGDGWFTLIDTLCALICWPYENARRRYDDMRQDECAKAIDDADAVAAIDVERARLTMQSVAETLPVVVQVKEKYGGLRFYIHGGNDACDRYIEFAEALSERTCEQCGAPGKLREGGWLKTLCDEHASER